MPFPSDASAALSSSLAQTIHDVAQCSTHTPSAESSYIHTLYLAHQPCVPLHEHRQIVEGVLVSFGEAMCLKRFLRRGALSLLHRPRPSTSALWTSKSIRHLLLTSFPILQGRQGHLLEGRLLNIMRACPLCSTPALACSATWSAISLRMPSRNSSLLSSAAKISS